MNPHSISRFPRKLKTPKGTCLLTPHGGFLDGLLHSEPMEPSAKPFQDSDRREPPNSRGMDQDENQDFPLDASQQDPLTPASKTPCTCAANFNVNKDELYFPNRARERREAPRARQAKVARTRCGCGGGGKSEKGGVLGAGKNDFVLATEHARSPARTQGITD